MQVKCSRSHFCIVLIPAEIEQAETKLDATMRKMAKVLNLANDRRQWMAIGVLSSAMVVLFVIIFAL